MTTLIKRFPGLAALIALFVSRVDGDDPERPLDPPEPDGEDEGPDPDADEDTEAQDDAAESDEEGESGEPARSARSRSDPEVGELRERTRRLEAEIELARATRAPAGPTPEQQTWEREQRLLDDPATTAQDRHAIETNRALRQSHALSSAAQARAEDLSDRAEYHLKALDNPVYRKYADRVEAERQRIGANGRGMPPRETVLAVLIGQDVLKGKVTPSKAGKKVSRQVPTRPRSDVSAAPGRTTREKLRARLENQII